LERRWLGRIVPILIVILIIIIKLIVIVLTTVLVSVLVGDLIVLIQIFVGEFVFANLSQRNGIEIVSMSGGISVILNVNPLNNWNRRVPVTIRRQSQMTFTHITCSSWIVVEIQLLNITDKDIIISHHFSSQNGNTVSTHFWEWRSIKNNFTDFSTINPQFGFGPTGLFVKTNSPTDFVPFGIVGLQHFGSREFVKL